jgi:hypothetical protein
MGRADDKWSLRLPSHAIATEIGRFLLQQMVAVAELEARLRETCAISPTPMELVRAFNA